MKKFYLIFSFVLIVTGCYSQTLITYGTHTVSVDEFLRAYNKNKTPVSDKEKELKDYINLYTNFKLKVQAATELRFDTLSQIRTDIENFRNQVQENYMSDEKGKELLIEEAVNRSYKDLHIIHFSVPSIPGNTPSDTLKAYQAIKTTYEELNKGSKDYRNIVQMASVSAAVKYNDVGFLTAFSLPYQFENIIYSLKPGESSKPYRTKNAWHVFKLLEERKSTGKWKIAQILFSIPPTATEENKMAIKKRADSVYNLLANGSEFFSIAKNFSEDKLTYLNGGELPEFSTGKYDYAFEKEVMQLKADGNISKPFQTPFGYHIVKRLGHTPLPLDKKDPVIQFDIKQKVLKDSRLDAAKQKFSKDVAVKVGLKKTNIIKETDLLRYADSVMKNPVIENAMRFPISNKKLITFNNGSLNASDWLKFVVEYKGNFDQYKDESNKELLDKYYSYAANNYYKDRLENYNDDFKYQMKEFKEGNMLFEIMERNVWGLANTDSAGMRKHYRDNKAKYIWPASAEVLIFNTTNEKTGLEIMEALKNNKPWRHIAEINNTSVQADSGRYELAQLALNNISAIPLPGTFSPLIKNGDGTASFIKFIKTYPAGGQRNFEDAKGLVINDYQNVLEEKWLLALRNKYPVKVNESLIKGLIRK
ncbi:MAG: peptidylprolyl isomerase [Ferruginibacter sp.]